MQYAHDPVQYAQMKRHISTRSLRAPLHYSEAPLEHELIRRLLILKISPSNIRRSR